MNRHPWRRGLTEAHETEHERVLAELAQHEEKILDMAARLVRLEATVEIYRPFFVGPIRRAK